MVILMKKLLCISLPLILISMFVSCAGSKVYDYTTITNSEGYSNIDYSDEVVHEKISNDIKYIYDRVKEFDFSVSEYSVDTAVYNSQTDKLYKKAYFKMLTNKTPLWIDDNGKAVYFKDFFRGEDLDNQNFLEYILKRAKYHYLDFEGDGLPELVIEADGLHIFKYSPDSKQIYLFYANHEKWHLLGSKKIYYYSATSANRKTYSYEEVNKDGRVVKSVDFEIYYEEGESDRYFVSLDELVRIEIDRSTWDEITKDYFNSINKPLPSITFEEIFNDLSI